LSEFSPQILNAGDAVDGYEHIAIYLCIWFAFQMYPVNFLKKFLKLL
jgi:hypothetical protein